LCCLQCAPGHYKGEVSKFDSVTKKACAGRGFLELVAARFREA